MAMNPERRAAALRQDAIIQQAVNPMRRAVAQEKNIYVRQCAEAWRNHQHLRPADFMAHQKRMEGILYKGYVNIGMKIHSEIHIQIKAKRPDIEVKAQSKFESYLQQWARNEAAKKAKPIAGTTNADINRAIQDAFASDDAETSVISSILAVRGYSAWRADAVARTETHNAAMYSSLETASDYADEESTPDNPVVMLKVWSPTVDKRTRDWHAAMEDYDAIPLDEAFQVENPNGGTDSMDRPGDQNAPPEQVINCRCVLTYDVQ